MMAYREPQDQPPPKIGKDEGHEFVYDDSEYMAEPGSAGTRLPLRVIEFLLSFNSAFKNKDFLELQNFYENVWPIYCERFYQKSPWPTVQMVEQAILPKAEPDELFLILYKWLYYRHIHDNFGLQFRDLFDCYMNYCILYNYIIMGTAPGETSREIDLPARLIWDIIDLFIVQFEVFNIKKARQNQLSPEDIELLKEKSEAWDVHSILNVLYSFIHTSRINEQLIASNTGEDVVQAAGVHGMKHTYRVFGYCSLVCLMRVQCVLGDYALALKAVEHLDLSSKGLIARITPCHITCYYYLGFTYMMLKRYTDAVNTFIHILLFISRMKNVGSKSYQVDDINSKADCIYALLAICVTITKQRIDESIHNVLREKHADNITKMQKAHVNEAVRVAGNLFGYACPAFISPVTTMYCDQNIDTSLLPLNHQLECFMYEMRLQFTALSTAARLKSYAAIKLDKLASFYNKPVEEIISELIIYKNRSVDPKGSSESSAPSTHDSYLIPPEIDFYIDDDILYISRTKQPRRIGDWIIRNTSRLSEVVAALKS